MKRLVWITAYVSKASDPAKALEFANQAHADYIAQWGHDDEGIEGKTGADGSPGLPGHPGDRLPVFRLRNGAEHFYTIDPVERDNAVSQYGYAYEGIAFYAYPTA